MRQHCENARRIATFLAAHPNVEQVYYPGLESHPDHALARRQMRDFGGMVSFAFKGRCEDVDTFVRGLKVFALAESLGGVESLCCHPASMTHGSIPAEEREKRGVTDTLLRLSVGIEDADDLIADLEQALARVPVAVAVGTWRWSSRPQAEDLRPIPLQGEGYAADQKRQRARLAAACCGFTKRAEIS